MAVLLGATLVAFASGCSSELDPSDPEGAYYIFRDALLEKDAQTVWERTDQETHAYYQARYNDLVEMDETIDRYLPQTDHKIARQQSGTVLLDEIDDGKGLFLKTFVPDELPEEEAIKVGSDIDEIKLAEDESSAKIITRAGQEYVLTRDDKTDEWRVMLVRSTDIVEKSFAWLDTNRSALQQTVEDLIAEEREKREAIIAELLNKKE